MDGYDALAAARDSAYWAAAAAIASWLIGLLALIANAVGIVLVWRQLRANTQAIAAGTQSAEAAARAADIAFASYRPWVMVTKLTFDGLLFQSSIEADCVIQGEVTIKNVGAGPALRTHIGITFAQVLGAPLVYEDIMERSFLSLYVDMAASGDEVSMPFSFVCNWSEFVSHRSGSTFEAIIHVTYMSPGSHDEHKLLQLWQCGGSIYRNTVQPFSDHTLAFGGRVPVAAKIWNTMRAT